MSRKEYFAYGSNLNFDQMAYRCPEATVVGTAKLDDYELAFRRGYLTILPKEGASVEGLIWSVTDHDESQLDCYEGYPTFYDKETMTVTDADASKANRIIDKLQLAVVDTGTAELIDTVQQERGETAPETERVQTEDGAVDFEVGADEEQFNMVFPQGSETASPSEPFSDSSKSFANSPSPRADQLRAKGERPSVRMELSDITAYLRRKVEPPKDRMPRMPVKIKRKDKVL